LTSKATWKREFKLPWREAGPPSHHEDKVDSDQWVVNKEVSLTEGGADKALREERQQHLRGSEVDQREFFIDNLLVRIHFISVMIRWTGLAPWEFEFPVPVGLTSTFLRG